VGWLKRGRDKQTDDLDPLAWVGEEDATDDDREYGEPGRGAGPTAGLVEPGSERADGPWDVSEVESSAAYVDLGGLWLPGRDGMELRLEVEEDSGRVIAATVQLGNSAVQLQAFAAPRTMGIWEEIRREIASSVTRQGGTADEVPGPFGRELLARVPSRTPDGRTAHQPARFVGIDGPRWFLRAVFHGEAAYQDEPAAELESLVREVVVVRGADAMAPRELLTLKLPDQGNDDQSVELDAQGEGRDPLRPFERGPEITEVR
jgi:hypothetical protein